MSQHVILMIDNLKQLEQAAQRLAQFPLDDDQRAKQLERLWIEFNKLLYRPCVLCLKYPYPPDCANCPHHPRVR